MVNTTSPQSIFPDLPREIPAVDKEGNLSPLWSLGLSSLFQALQDNFKNMKVSRNWLQNYVSKEIPKGEAFVDLLSMNIFEVEG